MYRHYLVNIHIVYLNINVLDNLYGHFIWPVISTIPPPPIGFSFLTGASIPVPNPTYEVTNTIICISINDIIDNDYKIYKDNLYNTIDNTYTKLLNNMVDRFHKLYTYKKNTVVKLKRCHIDDIESFNKKQKV